MSKDDQSTFDSNLLSEMSVAELRDICKKLDFDSDEFSNGDQDFEII